MPTCWTTRACSKRRTRARCSGRWRPRLPRFAVESGRPRAIVVAGMGGSGIAGDILSAVCGRGCPVQVTTVHDYHLPGWAGVADLVIAVSCSGSTQETLAAAHEAARRGCRLAAVGAAGSALADLAARARAPFIPV